MPISDSAASELAQLLGSGTAGELIPELVRQGLQAPIEAEAAAALGAEGRESTAQRRGHRNGSREPAATGRFRLDQKGDASGDARHHGT